MLTAVEYLAALERDSTALIEIVDSADLSREVPSCPGWTLLDLAKHVGSVHRWAHGAVSSGAPIEFPVGPDDPGELSRWLGDGSARLVALLRSTDPATPTWTFGPRPRQVSFWSRRQTHETSMHLFDARNSLGERTPISPEFAADGVEEFFSLFYPRQIQRGELEPIAPGIRIVLDEAPDVEYLLAGDGTNREAQTAAVVRGPAERVLRVLWGREGLVGLRVEGDQNVARSALGAALTP